MVGTITLVVVGIVLVGLFMLGVGIYNQLIQVNVNVDKSWANILVLEKQRYDEIPKLVDICNGYMKHERDVLEKVTLARTKFLGASGPKQVGEAGGALSNALKTLFAVSENYPDLKANQTFKQLQVRVSYIENQIADRREFYNDSVSIFNTRILQIPDVFVANMLNYQSKEMYVVPENQRDPQVINLKYQ